MSAVMLSVLCALSQEGALLLGLCRSITTQGGSSWGMWLSRHSLILLLEPGNLIYMLAC
jgi:hypothetical protein